MHLPKLWSNLVNGIAPLLQLLKEATRELVGFSRSSTYLTCSPCKCMEDHGLKVQPIKLRFILANQWIVRRRNFGFFARFSKPHIFKLKERTRSQSKMDLPASRSLAAVCCVCVGVIYCMAWQCDLKFMVRWGILSVLRIEPRFYF